MATETKNQLTHVEEAILDHNLRNAEVNLHNAVDFDDPHKAAIEGNPEKPQSLSWPTMLAIFVSPRRWEPRW